MAEDGAWRLEVGEQWVAGSAMMRLHAVYFDNNDALQWGIMRQCLAKAMFKLVELSVEVED